MEPEYEPTYLPGPDRRSYEDLQRPGPAYFEASWRPSCDRLTDALNQSGPYVNSRPADATTGSGNYGKTPLMSFAIETGDAPPYAARYYPIPAAYKSRVNQQMRQMQSDGVIEDANSPWSSNLVIVKKPNGKLRICANLKGVNALTKRTTSFPINFQEESLAKLCNGRYFFRIDLSQAYYFIPIDDPKHRDKTAFYTSGGQKRFRVSPFGAKYLPS